MKSSIALLFILFTLTACNQGVEVKKNLDGSETVKVNTADGSATATTKGDETTYKDDKGNEVNTKINADGSTTSTGKTADGTTFSTSTSGDVDLTPYGLKVYPGAESVFGSQSESGGKKAVQVAFNTTDSADKVIAFYAPMIKSDKTESKSTGASVLGGTTDKGAKVAIIVTTAGEKNSVSVTASLD